MVKITRLFNIRWNDLNREANYHLKGSSGSIEICHERHGSGLGSYYYIEFWHFKDFTNGSVICWCIVLGSNS